MTPDLYRRAKELFLAACERPPEERTAFLRREAGDDAQLLAAARELLDSDAKPHGFLDPATFEAAARRLLDDEETAAVNLPERIGPYRIVGLLGRGGMGTVYEAQQENPSRRVALKVLTPDLGRPEHLERFRREAQLLGRLRHPGIVNVHEAGTAEIGGVTQPYIVLELVDGTTLREHARSAGLTLEQRMELMAQVCDAVQHAHDHGVLHRDLKASNLLVDGSGQPKVLDFGVARLLGRDAGVTRTASGLVVGTLVSMSPEQVSAGAELDVRSDVYSLGVVAYELLTGRLPLEVASLPLPQAARVICEQDPPTAGRIDRRLAGDPETILAKALAKDRSQRYASARELAEDLRRYLRREPILARPASTFYQLRMFARRNRALVTGLLVAFLALGIGSVVSMRLALRESRLRQVAEEDRRRAERAAYRGNVIAAGLALQRHNRRYAETLLDELGSGSGWEFRRLERWVHPWLSLREVGVDHAWQAGFLGPGLETYAVGAQGDLRLWDAATGETSLVLAADPERAYPVGASAQGAAVLSVLDGGLAVWDLSTGVERGRVRVSLQPSRDPREGALAPDARHAVVLVQAQGMYLVDLGSGNMSRLGVRGPAAFDTGGRLVALATPTGIDVWRVEDGAPLEHLPPVADPSAIAFDPSGELLAVCGQRELRILDRASGREVRDPTLLEGASALAFAPDGSRVAGVLDDGTLLLWDREAVLLERASIGRHGWKSLLAWSPDGTCLLTAASAHSNLRLWSPLETRHEEALVGHSSYVYPVAWSPDGRRVISGAWDGTVRIWNAATRECLATLATGSGRVHAVAPSPDGRSLAAVTGEGTWIVWDVRTGKELARTRRGNQTWEAGVLWSPDGRTLVATSQASAGTVQLLSPDDLAVVQELRGPETAISALALDRSGGHLAAGTLKAELVLFDLASGAVLVGATDVPAVRALAFSPDGMQLAIAADGGHLQVRDTATLELGLELAGHQGEVFDVAFSPDGGRLFSGGRDGLLRVWDPLSGDLLGEFSGHRDYIWSLAVSPDGARIATGSGDHEVRIWESEPVATTAARRREAHELARWAGAHVAGLVQELGGARAAAERLEADPTLSAAQRAAALDELLRRSSAGR